MKRKNKFIKITAVVLLLSLLCSMFVFATSEETQGVSTVKNPYIAQEKPLVSAHRSGAGIAPENTLAAFKYCVESETFDTDIFEFDLHLTKDNVLILAHDATLDRTSNTEEHFGKSKVKIADKTYEELRALNLGEKFETEDGKKPYEGLRGDAIPEDLKVVKLEEVLDFLLHQEKEYSFIIEIKNKKELGYKAADELYRIVKEKNILPRVMVGTFNGDVTKYLDENYDDMIRSASIMEVLKFYFADRYNIKLKKENIKYDILQIPYKLLFFNLGTEKFINTAHRYDIALQYWTINDEEEMKELRDRGADAIISDYPDIASKVVNEKTSE